jgi:hypothetical protein
MCLEIRSILPGFLVYWNISTFNSIIILWILIVSVLMSTFSALILLIWIFSFFWLVCLKVYQSCVLFERNNYLCHCSYTVLLASISLISILIFTISFLLLILGLVCSWFSKTFEVHHYVISLRSFWFLNTAQIATNFLLRTNCTISHMFW